MTEIGDADLCRMLTIEQVLQRIPVGRTTLLQMEKKGRFPKGHFISGNRKVWLISDIAEWQRLLPTEAAQRRRGNNPVGRPRKQKRS
jgi:predicted DNA-binding transcriptional regulator AlpA